jgi:hypothetical protein
VNDNQATPISTKLLDFSGTQVTWAGELPLTHELGFGTEDGSLSVRNEEGVELSYERVLESKEAINGVAFSGDARAVSTRGELLVKRSSGHIKLKEILFPVGTHGVISNGAAGFIAPLGPSGAMTVELLPDGHIQGRGFRGYDVDLYFYKMVHLGSSTSGDDIVACAARTDGIMAIVSGRDAIPTGLVIHKCRGRKLNESVDIIDVCRLPSDTHPFATVSLGIDNSLHFSFDLLSDHTPLGLRFRDMQGIAYAVLSTGGHIFMLTSSQLYTVPNLADRLLARESLSDTMTVHRWPVEASDFMMAYGKHGILLADKGVLLFELNDLLVDRSVDQGRNEISWDLNQYDWEAPQRHALEVSSA